MLNELAKRVHETAIAKGWYEDHRPFPELIALMHSELSEALEAYRDGGTPTKITVHRKLGVRRGKPEGIAVELADCVIRILDACAYLGIDIDEAVRVKMEYNEGRPYRHGNKRA